MTQDISPIPVFVMSYNDRALLRLCLRALVRRTLRSCTITVVDNGSSEPTLVRYLGKLAALSAIRVVRNPRNLWVLGLNAPVRQWAGRADGGDFFAVTDCDILVPPVRDGLCWLTRLEQIMQGNVALGKVGLALDLGYIKSHPVFEHTYKRERFFMEGPRIGELVVAPVDTTMALYRRDVFVTDLPLFIPPHQSLYRPHYYVCRTPASFAAKHLSWRFYGQKNDDDVMAKLLCFGLMGATAVPALYRQAPLWAQWGHFLLKGCARLIWGVAVLFLHARHVARRFPRNLNEVQAERRA